jgi:hypothetical protein
LDGVLYSKIDDEFLRYRNNETLVVSIFTVLKVENMSA